MARLPASLLAQWGVVPGPGEAWLEALAPLQYVAYPLRDTDGRPLGELNVPPELRADVVADVRPCPHADRAGLPTNATAMRLVAGHWPWVLESLAALRDGWVARHGRLDAARLWSLAAVVLALPPFLLRTGAAEAGVPAEVSGLFKVGQGLFVTAWREWLAAPVSVAPLDPDALVDGVVAARALHNPSSGRVCPASLAMVRELFATCLAPPRPPPPPDATAALFAYGSAYAALTLEKWLLTAPSGPAADAVRAHRDALAGWSDAPDSVEERFTALQRAACAAAAVAGPRDTFALAWVAERRGSG